MSGVQWFPGHMARAKRIIRESLKRVDLVIEVLDARGPRASANPLLRAIVESKPRLVLMNKDDLADPSASRLWSNHFSEERRTLPIRVSAARRSGIDLIQRRCLELCRSSSASRRRPLRALIAGIPNVGKSTIINALSGRRRAETGATPGLTRDLRRIRISDEFELFDTPGILWHKFEDRLTGIILAALGAVKESVLPEEEVAAELLLYLSRRYPDALSARYGLGSLPADGLSLAAAVGRNRGCLLPGGKIDLRRTCGMVLKDLREGRFGRLSLEWPDGAGWS